MVYDMSEVYKMSMVRMSNMTDELKKLKGLDTTLWKHKGLFQHSVSEVE